MFKGYKCFKKGLINRYGTKFEIDKEYHANGIIKFGNYGNGFHVCKNLEDTLRYFNAMNEPVDIAEVICHGMYDQGEDDYNGYYDMYAFEYLFINKILTREEIIDYGLKLYDFRTKRFISGYRLTKEEILLFKEKFKNNQDILNTIAYYQEGNIEAFNSSYKKTRMR